jgi:ATP-binding cassette subfamily B protein/subfamily B ATP-binding cassette protein MsbA
MKIAKRFILMAKKYWGVLVIATVGLVGAAILNLVTPEIVRRMIALIQNPENIKAQTIMTYIAILIIAYLLRAVCRYISMSQSHVAAWNFVGELILTVYDKLQVLSMKYFSDQQTGQLMSRMANDTRLLEVLIAHALPDMVSNLLVIISVAVMIFVINPTLALFTLIPVPFVIIISTLFSKKVAPLFKINAKVLGELNGVLQDNLSGMKEIQAFGKEEKEHTKLLDWCKNYSQVNINANYANAVYHPSVEFITSIGTVIVVGFGSLLVSRSSMSVADVVGFFMYLGLFYQPLTVLARIAEDMQSAFAGGARVLEVLDIDPDIKNEPDAVEIGRSNGNIVFDNVSFRYNEEEPVLNNISFQAKSGEMVALVGATGVGKTTIISLIERFYMPNSGKILLDNVDINKLTLKNLRDNISIVLQDVFLFNGSVFDNIAYGAENATLDEVKEAAKIACADSFINEMPEGYNTLIGERGVRLSGGQKQRLAIARAVLRNTPILILDEATSSVDTETEAKIQEAIENLSGSRTLIVIAHRLSTVMKSNKILVIENGKIIEQGKHGDLLKQGGTYAKLCNIQYDNLNIG